MNLRRRRLLCAAPAAVCGGVFATACSDASEHDRQLVLRNFDDALRELDRLAALPALQGASAWNFPQTLVHCAQSVEYSLTGFPQPRSALFQHTLGHAAFRLFAWRGRMRHDLAEPIPGAPVLPGDSTVDAAMSRLQRAVAQFRGTATPLHAHFAYGALDKAQYEQAHAMHIANHLSMFRAPA